MQNSIAVSTWSLHHHIGHSYANGPGQSEPYVKSNTWGTGVLDIMQLPAALAARGYSRCEICHFHLASREVGYLKDVSRSFATAGVVIQTLLIDDGDITGPATRQDDLAWIATWIEAAGHLNAEHARVIAGKTAPTAETLALSVAGLRPLVALGESIGVKVVTENWHALLSTPDAVHHVLDQVQGLGFMADTGNWTGARKYEDLQAIFKRANLCHAKAHFEPGLHLDESDFSACLTAARRGGYTGPLTLIFADAGDEWSGLALERDFIRQFGGDAGV